MLVFAAREGADVTIAYLPEEEEDAQKVKKMIESEGKKCLCVPTNVMEDEQCKNLIKTHLEFHGRLDVLGVFQLKCEARL
jgi:NAD(P)-dependent dehydrogenase (short-subunit alcohol dehydrogenase family)